MSKALMDDDLAFVQDGLGSHLDSMLIYNLLRTESQLSPFLDAGLRRQKVTATQFNALLVLAWAGSEGMLMKAIGEHLIVTKSNITGLIDRLERQELVERCHHRDRRATVIRLTRNGKRVLQRTIPGYAELLTELSDCLSAKEKETLIRIHTKLRRGLRRKKKERLS